MDDVSAANESVPIEVCEPLTIWTLVPFAAVAILLLLPDYAEVGVGGVAFKRLEDRLVGKVEEATRDIRDSLTDATGMNKDIAAGTVHKGTIRNVELRVRTVQEILLSSLLSEPTERDLGLYRAGFTWGKSWSQDFNTIESSADIGTAAGVRQVVNDWAYYDATAGLGRFQFDDWDDVGLPTAVEVRNSFLAVERDGIDLRNLMGGYIAGSLEGLLEPRQVRVEAVVASKSIDRDRYDLKVSPIS